MLYSLLADAVVAIHVVYVSYVLLGQLAIWLGLFCRSHWVRNPWFRWTHLVMMSIVGIEAIFDVTCPLTTLEDSLRESAGDQSAEGSFVGRLLHDLIFVDASPSTLAVLHITFALVVIGTFVLVRPRSFRRPKIRRESSDTVPPSGIRRSLDPG
jgi:hypothetical protein